MRETFKFLIDILNITIVGRQKVMNKKIIGIFLVTLLIATAISAVGTRNIEKSNNIRLDPKPSSTDIVWSDNFDSYYPGQFLDGTPEDGGWKGWFDDPIFGAFVVDVQALSSPNSVDIVRDADLMHEFTGICSGTWTLSCYCCCQLSHRLGLS